MQLVSTTRDILLKPLQVVSGIVERRHTLPILANFLMRKQKEQISFIVSVTASARSTSSSSSRGPAVASRFGPAPTRSPRSSPGRMDRGRRHLPGSGPGAEG